MTSEWQDKKPKPIQRYAGTPIDSGTPEEKSRWARFLSWLRPYASRTKDLAAQYAEAELRERSARADERQATAELKAQEAAEAAARVDQARNKTVEQFAELVDSFDLDDDAARELKIAKLIEQNPDLAEQLQKLKSLERQHGIRITTPSLPQLAEGRIEN